MSVESIGNNDGGKIGSIEINADGLAGEELKHSGNGHHQNIARLSKEELEEQEMSALAFLFFLVFLQVALFTLKAKYPKRFQEVTLGFMWLYPLLVVYRNNDLVAWTFFSGWVAWSVQTLWLVHEARQRPLKAKTPEKVYKWFLATHNICYFTGMGSIYAFFFIPAFSLLALFFALYFGVLGRDFAELSAERISSTIGYTKYETPPKNLCALCGEELKPTLQMMAGEIDENDKQYETYTLTCGHEFHSTCIKGWCIVGKKQTCPFCLEKVDLKSLIPDWAWNSKRLSVLWVRLLDVLRFLVVWNPIVVNLDLFLLKIFHFRSLVDHKTQ